ncbi:hypothetical protein JVT61DRAFT_7212 [Boletus reticuloceps]|uniref:Methyltransferase domain-containing protein n=1 Tax=Boletus reticuloceps TaxID=495285 RepID=A0A8I2YIP7_9AGAM|nr:hypothetical protein JVT61DRAFT_7212 [Boletus reticuloceps]
MCPAYNSNADTTDIVHLISSPVVASLLSIHPNDVALHGHQLAPQWSPWWDWASDYPQQPPAWLELMHYFMRPCVDDRPRVDIPAELCSLVDSVRSLQLQRTPSAYETCNTGDRAYRISPKKEHEVDRMSSYIHHLVHSESPRSVWHAVDVGSGQGYLSRALQELDFHVLALDNNESQTLGANQWTTKEAARKVKRRHRGDSQTPDEVRKGSLTHQTVHVFPRRLEDSVANWLSEHPDIRRNGEPDLHHPPTRPEPVPVLMVALHACGSLTVDVLRTFLLGRRPRTPQATDENRAWRPHSLVVVGCCYNLMSPSGTPSAHVIINAGHERPNVTDFPLSKPLRDLDPVPKLTIAAVHLAAQVPSQWLKDAATVQSAALALRKVVYRALLQPVLQAAAAQPNSIADHAIHSERPIQSGLGESPENRRLGKLNDRAYQDWPTFLERATDKLGINLVELITPLPAWFTHEAARLKMESALFVLQTLRCILGPLIETLILLDRRDWIKDELAEMSGGQEVEVEMVNLFDQATGSGRNVALVMKPATNPQRVMPVIERN